MKSETWIFVACTVFFALVTPAYALVTAASEHGLDWTGTSALTMATRVLSCSSTRARTVSSPFFWVTTCEAPTPPLTGSNGSGVTWRTAMPARKSAETSKVSRARHEIRADSFSFMTGIVAVKPAIKQRLKIGRSLRRPRQQVATK